MIKASKVEKDMLGKETEGRHVLGQEWFVECLRAGGTPVLKSGRVVQTPGCHLTSRATMGQSMTYPGLHLLTCKEVRKNTNLSELWFGGRRWFHMGRAFSRVLGMCQGPRNRVLPG